MSVRLDWLLAVFGGKIPWQRDCEGEVDDEEDADDKLPDVFVFVRLLDSKKEKFYLNFFFI